MVTTLLAACLTCGCGQQRTGERQGDSAALKELGPTIESLARFIVPGPVRVEGYGLVSGLRGTGSAECPPRIRAYLSRYIRRQLPAGARLDVDKYINRRDTAVVYVEGIIPPLLPKGEYIDVLVTALPGTQTTSLEDGWLFETELKLAGSFGVTMTVPADAKGPIFTDKLNSRAADARIGHILAGGKILENRRIMLVMTNPDLEMTNRIRNRINGRFGRDTARAITAGQIELSVPARYSRRPQMFIGMVRATYLAQEPQLDQQRIAAHVRRLVESPDKIASEVALEAIGNQCLDELGALLKSPDERVRFHAARCTLNLGGDPGLLTLREIALNKNSAFRLDALLSITVGAARNDAAAVSRLLLRDENFLIRLAAYEQLRELDDASVSQEQVAGNFYIERIA
ncbi:MAG: flagellar basal body P-ring protein FlgI, partial [Phycisphaerales bacterium]